MAAKPLALVGAGRRPSPSASRRDGKARRARDGIANVRCAIADGREDAVAASRVGPRGAFAAAAILSAALQIATPSPAPAEDAVVSLDAYKANAPATVDTFAVADAPQATQAPELATSAPEPRAAAPPPPSSAEIRQLQLNLAVSGGVAALGASYARLLGQKRAKADPAAAEAARAARRAKPRAPTAPKPAVVASAKPESTADTALVVQGTGTVALAAPGPARAAPRRAEPVSTAATRAPRAPTPLKVKAKPAKPSRRAPANQAVVKVRRKAPSNKGRPYYTAAAKGLGDKKKGKKEKGGVRKAKLDTRLRAKGRQASAISKRRRANAKGRRARVIDLTKDDTATTVGLVAVFGAFLLSTVAQASASYSSPPIQPKRSRPVATRALAPSPSLAKKGRKGGPPKRKPTARTAPAPKARSSSPKKALPTKKKKKAASPSLSKASKGSSKRSSRASKGKGGRSPGAGVTGLAIGAGVAFTVVAFRNQSKAASAQAGMEAEANGRASGAGDAEAARAWASEALGQQQQQEPQE